MGAAPAIEVEKLCVRYWTRKGVDVVTALDNVSLEIAAGSFFTVIGPSGCGKTTLLKTIAGLIEPTSGTVRTSSNGAGDAEMSILFQKALLLPWRTSLDNVLLPIEVHARSTSADLANAEEMLNRVGLADFTSAYPHELSAGMQQRVAIARTLIRDPSILLMDEPFSALDELTRETMNFELLRIWEDSGKTVVFVTHNVAEAVFLSDEIVVMGPAGTVETTIEVDLPRPRNAALLESREYSDHLSAARRALGLDR